MTVDRGSVLQRKNANTVHMIGDAREEVLNGREPSFLRHHTLGSIFDFSNETEYENMSSPPLLRKKEVRQSA